MSLSKLILELMQINTKLSSGITNTRFTDTQLHFLHFTDPPQHICYPLTEKSLNQKTPTFPPPHIYAQENCTLLPTCLGYFLSSHPHQNYFPYGNA